MPAINKLTDHKIKALKPGDKPVKHSDGGGLYLFVTPAGAKVWRMSYRVDKKPQTATFGPYPLVTLAEARVKRDDAKRAMLNGAPVKPVPAKVPTSITLQKACDAYFLTRKDLSPSYLMNFENALKRHILPVLGDRPVRGLTRADVLDALNRMDAAGLHVYVRKTRMWLGQVFDWCIEQEHCDINPCALIRPDKAFTRAVVESFAALELSEVRAFMDRLDLEGELQSAMACRLLALTWTRTAELRGMLWSEIEGDVWRVPASRMKRRRDHLVPLSKQALVIIEKMRARSKGSEYVFPNDRRIDRPMSENAILYLLGRMGYGQKMTGHGWRSVASTWANENGYPSDAIERQLAHSPDDKVRAVYLRSEFMDVRRKMLADYAGWLMPG
jgi:integrase